MDFQVLNMCCREKSSVPFGFLKSSSFSRVKLQFLPVFFLFFCLAIWKYLRHIFLAALKIGILFRWKWLYAKLGSLWLCTRDYSWAEYLCRFGKHGEFVNFIKQSWTLCQVVENPLLSNQVDGAQSAYQYFENVRNFLVAVEEMGLPSFEASDLEQVSCLLHDVVLVPQNILNFSCYSSKMEMDFIGEY